MDPERFWKAFQGCEMDSNLGGPLITTPALPTAAHHDMEESIFMDLRNPLLFESRLHMFETQRSRLLGPGHTGTVLFPSCYRQDLGPPAVQARGLCVADLSPTPGAWWARLCCRPNVCFSEMRGRPFAVLLPTFHCLGPEGGMSVDTSVTS